MEDVDQKLWLNCRKRIAGASESIYDCQPCRRRLREDSLEIYNLRYRLASDLS